jgi:hypothetical protein
MEFHLAPMIIWASAAIVCIGVAAFVARGLGRHEYWCSSIQSRQGWELFATIFGVLVPGIVLWFLTDNWVKGVAAWVILAFLLICLFRYGRRDYLKRKDDAEFDRQQRVGEDCYPPVLHGPIRRGEGNHDKPGL